MGQTAKTVRENRTITVDFQDRSTYFQLIHEGKACVECVFTFLLALGFQLKHKASCRRSGCLTRQSPYTRVRLGGLTICWPTRSTAAVAAQGSLCPPSSVVV